MDERLMTTEQFEQLRAHLTSVAYSMLGSVSEAQDAVQECWLRLDRGGSEAIRDLRAWLTTVVSRICLDMLRSRQARREDYGGTWLPEPLVSAPSPDETGPEQQAVMADSIGLALLIVLESLSPPERLAFVLHDVFGMPFEEVAPIVERTPEAARQLASRARRRVRSAPEPDPDLAMQRRVVDAFLAAARVGDFEALLAVLDPDVVIRFDAGAGQGLPSVSGAESVARRVLATAPRFIGLAQPVMVNGTAGALFGTREAPRAVLGFTIVDGRIVALHLIADQAKLRHALL